MSHAMGKNFWQQGAYHTKSVCSNNINPPPRISLSAPKSFWLIKHFPDMEFSMIRRHGKCVRCQPECLNFALMLIYGWHSKKLSCTSQVSFGCRVWNLMNTVTLLPTQDVLSSVDALLASVPFELRTRSESQVLGRLRHHVKWRFRDQQDLCGLLREWWPS